MVNKVVVTTFSPLPFSYCSYYTVYTFIFFSANYHICCWHSNQRDRRKSKHQPTTTTAAAATTTTTTTTSTKFCYHLPLLYTWVASLC